MATREIVDITEDLERAETFIHWSDIFGLSDEITHRRANLAKLSYIPDLIQHGDGCESSSYYPVQAIEVRDNSVFIYCLNHDKTEGPVFTLSYSFYIKELCEALHQTTPEYRKTFDEMCDRIRAERPTEHRLRKNKKASTSSSHWL